MTKNTYKHENELSEQLATLPSEAPVTDHWQSIKAAIEAADASANSDVSDLASNDESNVVSLADKRKPSHWLKAVSSIAAVLMVALVGLQFMSSPFAQSSVMSLDKGYMLTVASLEQGNGAYYQQLSALPKAHAVQAKSTLHALQDVRAAKELYQNALAQAPSNAKLQKKVITTLQKERKILRSLVV